ncbi:MAG: hypothetical protein Q7R31_00560 [Candidatus Levybacteria bacterium]|nr:hypothetical protein [Candidatus Levybacteria bacterium]
MAGFGGFYKGEKKKKKKGSAKSNFVSPLGAPTLTMPEIISKKKKYE